MGNQLNCLAQCQARQEGAQRLLVLQKGGAVLTVECGGLAMVAELWAGCRSLLHAQDDNPGT
jgi:hypothetical protein